LVVANLQLVGGLKKSPVVGLKAQDKRRFPPPPSLSLSLSLSRHSDQLSIGELSRRRLHLDRFIRATRGEEVAVAPSVDERFDWMGRYRAAMAAPDDIPADAVAK
jgi:hypothetical protein